ncbi:collagen binding domain-containing protein [Lactiplantibacillus carotarum]|uniref:collagen binding domain-containing protein n=1 Tax=Lactiplantibacillus carotarum TaxID=2993456 RepID=UPI00298F2624|nr:collagen binding domain-containing protein [Lactiplantibacillus carotarum]
MLKANQHKIYWLLGLLGVMLAVMVSYALPARAATNYNAKDYTTSAGVINGPDYKHADTVQLSYQLAFGETTLKDGDTITLDLPDILRARTVGDVFDVTDEETGAVIGTGEVTSDGQVVLTMNKNCEGKKNTEIKLNLATKYRGEDIGEKDVVFNLENGQTSTDVINIVRNEAHLSKKGDLNTETGMIKWTLLVNRQEINMEKLSIMDTIGDHQELVKDVEVYNGSWSSATTYKRKNKIDESAYNVNYHDDGFQLDFNDTVSNLVVIDYYTKVTDTDLMNNGYHFKNNAIMEWGAGSSGGRNKDEANGKAYDKAYNNGSGTGDLSSSSSSILSSSSSSSAISSSSDSSSSSSSSAISSSSDSSSSSSSSAISSSSDSSSSSSSSAISSSSDNSSSSSSSAISSSSDNSSSSSSSVISSSSDGSSASSSSAATSSSDGSNSASSSSSSSVTSSSATSSSTNENGGGTTTTAPDDPEDNTDVNPDIDEDTGTIDVDGGFADDYVDGTTAPDANSSSKFTSSASSVFSSSNRKASTSSQTATSETPAPATSTPATKKSSAKTTVSQANAATPQQPTKAKLPQTNETRTDGQALRAVGILLAALTLGGGALLRHWF